VLCALCMVALIYWRLARQSRSSEPSWRDDELTGTIARRCRKILRSYGIEASVSGDVTLFDMLVLGGQFRNDPVRSPLSAEAGIFWWAKPCSCASTKAP
jgi:hypothetical protein